MGVVYVYLGTLVAQEMKSVSLIFPVTAEKPLVLTSIKLNMTVVLKYFATYIQRCATCIICVVSSKTGITFFDLNV